MTEPFVTEAQYMQQIKDAARALNWRTFHCFNSRRSDKGFPDLLLIRGPNLLTLEVKSERGRVTAEQADWIAAFKQVKYVDAAIARPPNWDEILDVLTRAVR